MIHDEALRNPVMLIGAAGRSARMRGSDKLLRKIEGVAQLRRIALAAIATGCGVAVTLPPDRPERNTALDGLDVVPLTIPNCDEGISASLRAGASFSDGRPLMFVPADMPELTAEDLAILVRAHRQTPNALLRATSGDRQGHPVLFPADLVPELHQLSGDIGARSVVSRNAHRLRLVPLPDNHAVLDLDTPEAWAKWEATFRSKPTSHLQN